MSIGIKLKLESHIPIGRPLILTASTFTPDWAPFGGRMGGVAGIEGGGSKVPQALIPGA